MANYDAVDFFTDQSLIEDPYPYFDHLRAQCPVLPTDHYGVVAVSGYDEASDIYRDIETFSSCNSVIGPFATFPVPLEGDDISGIIDALPRPAPDARAHGHDGPPDHTRERALIMRLLTPKRLKENEAFMWRLADRQIDEFVSAGRCEFITRLRPALRHADRGRRARGARSRSRAVPPGLRAEREPRARSAGEQVQRQCARMAR